MPGFYELVTRYVSPYYFPVVVVFLLVIFIVAGYFIYSNYMGEKDSRNDAIYQPTDDVGESSDGNNKYFWSLPWFGEKKYTDDKNMIVDAGKDVRIYFFTADWCPHCLKAKPIIDEFERDYNNKTINGHKVIVVRVDCTDSEIPEIAKQINEFNVTSFPTVKIKDSKGNVFEFDAKITHENLENFVKSVANN